MQSFTSFLKSISLLLFVFLSVQMQAQFTVSGTIAKANGDPVESIEIQATDLGSVITDASGYYEFNAPSGYSGNLTIVSPLDYANGVTGSDALILRALILGVLPWNDPYQLIAGNINDNDIVSTLDLVYLNLLLDGTNLDFNGAPSWKFIDADYQFPNPSNPWEQPIGFTTEINDLAANQVLNYTAIKMGDLDGSAVGGFNMITGNIYFDENENCLDDDGGIVPDGWSIALQGSNAYYQALNQNGSFIIVAPSGDYVLELTAPNPYWGTCQNAIPITIDNAPLDLSIGAQKIIDCPYMKVDLSAVFLRRCFASDYDIHYCNTGTVLAEDASVTVHFDPFLSVLSTSEVPTSVDGNIYTFDLGDVDAGECGTITALVEVSCDALLGQTHCSEANIFPAQLCMPIDPLWSGADLELKGECIDNDVKFTITNVGEDMDEPANYVIIEDLLVKNTGQIELNAGEFIGMQQENFGTTCRLEVEQVAYHPYGHALMAFVEGCGTHPDGSVSLGLVTQFQFDGDKPFTDVDCVENVGSWDPNDIQGFPRGYTDEHLIEKGQSLEYLIRFQNTGTDTAFHVRVENPLPSEMDWSSLRQLGSSHDYEYSFEGDNLVFYFTDIMLPDSNVNEATSHGYIRYSLDQKEDLEIGDVINNQASIYFDFNEPVVTNETWHTIGEALMTVEATEVFIPNLAVEYFPNPFADVLTVQLKTDDFKTAELEIFDANGRLIKIEKFESRSITLTTEELNEGFYFFHVTLNGQSAASGKIVRK